MKRINSQQRGLSLLEVSLALVLVALGAINVANQMTLKIQQNRLNVIVAKINIFSNAVQTYLRDHQKSQGTITNQLTADFLYQNGYLADGKLSAMLTPQDVLQAYVKEDTGSHQLRALVYNTCVAGKCAGLLKNSSNMINARIGNGGGKKVNENGQEVLKGNFDSWLLKKTDWPEVNFSYPSIFKLVKYTPIPTGRFTADSAGIEEMTYTLTSAGITSKPTPIVNRDINWYPLYTNDKLVLQWKNNGVSYIVLQIKDTSDNSIKQTSIVRSSSVTIFPAVKFFNKKYEITATAYDENGLPGRQFTLPVTVKRYNSSIWKKFKLDVSLRVAKIENSQVVYADSCIVKSSNGLLPLYSTDTFMTLKGFSAQLPSGDSPLPADTMYLETQKVDIDFNGSRPVSLNFNDPAALQSKHTLDDIAQQYGTVPLLSAIKLSPGNSHLYYNVEPGCIIDKSNPLSFYKLVYVAVDKKASRILVIKNRASNYRDYNLEISNG